MKITSIVICATLIATAGKGNLVVNGDFEGKAEPANMPEGWSAGNAQHINVVKEQAGDNDNAFLRISLPESGTQVTGQKIELPEDAKSLTLSIKMRAADIVPGDQNWHTARFAYEFYNAAGEKVGGYPPALEIRQSSDEWKTITREVQVPAGAVRIQVLVGLWSSQGQVDFDEVSVVRSGK